jgi:hypothetical protein
LSWFAPADVLDPDHGAGFALPDDDVLELLGRDEAARGAHRVGEFLVLGRRCGADLAGGRLQVLLLDRVDDVRGGKAQLGELVGPEPDPHSVVRPAEEIHLRDARNAQQLVAQVDPGVVDQEVGVVGVRRRVDRDHHQNAGALLLDGDALLRGFLRQARLCRRHAVLGEDVRDVLVRSDLEIDVELHASVAGV